MAKTPRTLKQLTAQAQADGWSVDEGTQTITFTRSGCRTFVAFHNGGRWSHGYLADEHTADFYGSYSSLARLFARMAEEG